MTRNIPVSLCLLTSRRRLEEGPSQDQTLFALFIFMSMNKNNSLQLLRIVTSELSQIFIYICSGVCSARDCDVNAQCSSQGSKVSCSCKPDYQGDGRICVPRNPCSENNGGCPINSTICVFRGPNKVRGSPPEPELSVPKPAAQRIDVRTKIH